MPKIHTPPAKRFFRVHISYLDFAQAIIFIAAAQKQDESSAEWWGLITAAIVAYGRPFSGNERERRNRPVAADSNLIITPPILREIISAKDDRKLHRRILRLRNKAVAHSESRFYSLRIKRSDWAGHPKSGSDFALFSTQWHPANEGIDLLAFIRIAQSMRTYCGFDRYCMAGIVYEERRQGRRARASGGINL